MKRIHLLSCDRCKRQLDVTALEIGDEVQCVCDALLSVGPPREVQIRGLVCGHCGGVIGEGDTTCSYCSATLSAEDRKETTLCPICAARLANDSQHCKSCGVELRVAAVPPLPREGKCPRCSGSLRVHLLPDAEVVECAGESGCGGLWCTRETFERLQRAARRAASTGESDSPVAPRVQMLGAPEGSKRQYIPCLACDDFMQRRQFRHQNRATGIVLDVCKEHGIWFDRDELEAALAFVRSQVRSRSGLDPLPTRTPTRPEPSVKIFDARDSRYGPRTGASSVLESLVWGVLGALFH